MGLLNDTVLTKNVSLNKRKKGGNGKEFCKIRGCIFPKQIVEEIIHKSVGSTPIALEGAPGTGKSFFVCNAYPYILEEIFNVPYDLIYTNPYQLKSPSDIFVRPSLRKGDLVWELTWPIKVVKKAKKNKRAVLWVIEEYTRMSSQAQNFFLELCNSKTIHIEQTGDVIELPPFSKVVLIGNPAGAGVSIKHEALTDRIISIDWPMPMPEVIAKMILNRTETNGSFYKEKATSFGVKLERRKLTEEVVLAIIEAAFLINTVRKDPISLRGIMKCSCLYISSSTIFQAVDYMIKSVLAKDLSIDDIDTRMCIMNVKNNLLEKITM